MVKGLARYLLGKKGRHVTETANELEIVFATDFHGSTEMWSKFATLVAEVRPDLAIAGGDFKGKALAVAEGIRPDAWQVKYPSSRVLDAGEVLTWTEDIARQGIYAARVSQRQSQQLAVDEDYAEGFLMEAARLRLRTWAQEARTLKQYCGRLMLVPGNDDGPEMTGAIREIDPSLSDEHVRIGEWDVISVGTTPPTPWKTPGEAEESEILAEVSALLDQTRRCDSTVLVAHSPPYNTLLDIGPDLDEEMRVRTAGGRQRTKHIGSRAIREILITRGPLISLHGHVHESRGIQYLGRTLALNPGSEYSGGTLTAAHIRAVPGKVIDSRIISR